MDGVLADMEGELVRQAEMLFGRPMPLRPPDRDVSSSASATLNGSGPGETPPPESTSPAQAAAEALPDNVPPLIRINMSTRQQRKLWHHVESIENFWQTLNETEPGIVARLASVATERRWEVIFLTKRPETAGATAQLQSQRWLESKGFRLPSVYVVKGSRGRIAASLGLDIVIDDRPENCLDVVVDSRARAILVWRDDEKLLPGAARRLGSGVVKSVGECLDILTKVDSKEQESAGVVDRVKRLLGLKETARA